MTKILNEITRYFYFYNRETCTHLQMPRQKEEDEANRHAQEGERNKMLSLLEGSMHFPTI